MKYTKQQLADYINKTGVVFRTMSNFNGNDEKRDKAFVEGLGDLKPESITDEMLGFAHRGENDLNAPIQEETTLEEAASFIVEMAYLNQENPEYWDGENSMIVLNV